MDGDLIQKALCFHGKPMQKIWEDERGVGDLQVAGVPDDGNYGIYMERQKYFTFQDRAKRLKLHQFLARKASDLYDKDLSKLRENPIKLEQDGTADDKNCAALARLPPYETFLTKHQEKVKRSTLESIKPGDIVYALVVRGVRGISLSSTVKPLCTDESDFKMLQDYKIKGIIPVQFNGLPLEDNLGSTRFIETNDYVRCEVLEFVIYAERMMLSLVPSATNKNVKLGKILPEELPTLYSKMVDNGGMEIFEGYLNKAKEFDNPNYDILYGINGLDIKDNFTMMSCLKYGFPIQDYARELRQQQASKWAFRSVAEGIEYFKIGQHVEAFQCLNKALNIDPRNVEGLVARGALYANKGSFLKAVEDFEKALKLNSFHVNARKYMGETLVALGRSYEEDNRIQDAAKAYRDCLNIIPKHDQATMLLEAIQQRTGAAVDVIAPASTGKPFEATGYVKVSSPSNGSASEDSSSDSSSDSEVEIGTIKKRDPSLSPLSKKMALHAQQMESTSSHREHFHQPFYMSSTNKSADSSAQPPQVIANEFKLDEDDTELRVRKLLQDASKHKKDKKKTKKSKKSKKSKKTGKSSKDSAKHTGHIEYNYVINTESTLNANLKQYEKSIEELKKRQQKLSTEQPSTSDHGKRRHRQNSETPPPPPSINFGAGNGEANKIRTVGFGRFATQAPSAGLAAQKFSFQIKRPVKVDKFGLIRLATPALNRSPTPPPASTRRKDRSRSASRNRSRSRKRSRPRRHSRSRSRTRSKSRSHHRHSRTRSRSAGRHRRWRSRSRSNSRERYNDRRRRRSTSSQTDSLSSRRRRDFRSRSRDEGRRTPSPFVPRGTPSPRRHGRRSPSPRGGFRRGGRGGGGRGRGSLRGSAPVAKFGNRVWKNPNKESSPAKIKKPSSSDDRWVHDKFENPSDDPTIEEIDEIISKAQKERKQNIINNDKNILRKSTSKW